MLRQGETGVILLRSFSLFFAAAILFPGLAHAQIGGPLTCSAAVSVPPLLRAEGVSELLGDIVLTCSGGTTSQYTIGGPLPTVAITVSLPADITSRLLNTTVNPNVSEALLLIDEPGSGLPTSIPGSGPQAPQTVCSSATLGAASGGCTQYAVAVGNLAAMSSNPGSVVAPANIYQGLWNSAAPNQIVFPAIPVLAPVNSGTRIYRITNIRANVSALVGSGLSGVQQLSASVSISGSTSISLNSPVQTAGFIETSLTAATRNLANTGSLTPPQYSGCAVTAPITPVAIVQFAENFATAFKTRVQQTGAANGGQQPSLTQNVPGSIYNSESDFTIQTPNGTAGLADYGTRLKATFHGIPAGFRIFVSVGNVTNSSVAAPANGSQAAMVTSETGPDSSVVVPAGGLAYPAVYATTTIGGIPAAEIVADVTGTATAVWESISNNPAALDQYAFVVYVLPTGTASPNANATVNLSYAPTPPANSSAAALSAWGEASATLTLPRFADDSTAESLFTTGAPGFCVGAELMVTVSHAGGFALGATGDTYTILVTNTGLLPTSGTVTVVDNLPTGLTATAISGTGWSCALASLTCTRGDALGAGAGYSSILITVNIASNATSPLTNQVMVSGGGSPAATATDVATIGSGPPAVTVFSPSAGSTSVSTGVTLSWGGSPGATSYLLYLGTSPTPPEIATTGSTSYAVNLTAATTYYWSVTAVNASGSTPSAVVSFTTVTNGSLFVPVTPCRVMDTRNATGTFGGPYMTAGSTRTVPVPASGCGIPSSATAYSLNITVVPHGALNYLTIWPSGQTQPYVSTLNSYNGLVVANAAIVPAGTSAFGSGVNVYVSDATDVILDIDGYFASPQTAGALAYYPVTPCRIVDTRSATSAFGPYLSAGTIRSFALPSGPCPGLGAAQAYSLNVTVVPHEALQYLTVWPEGQSQPYVSTLNSSSAIVVANAAIVPAGGLFSGPGGIDVYATGDTDLVIDINGYFAAPGLAGALAFYPVTPCRVADTRNTTGPIPANGQQLFAVGSSGCLVPQAAQSYALNVTAIPSGTQPYLNYLTVWPAGEAQPVVSTLNSPTGTVVANAAIVGAGSAAAPGEIWIFASNPTNVVLDINGYFGQ